MNLCEQVYHRRRPLRGDGPAIGRDGYHIDMASGLVANCTVVLVTDFDELFLHTVVRALDLDPREVAGRILRREALD